MSFPSRLVTKVLFGPVNETLLGLGNNKAHTLSYYLLA